MERKVHAPVEVSGCTHWHDIVPKPGQGGLGLQLRPRRTEGRAYKVRQCGWPTYKFTFPAGAGCADLPQIC